MLSLCTRWTIFSSAKFARTGKVWATITGLFQFGISLISSIHVDIFCRRPTLSVSAVGMSICHVGMAYYFKLVVDGQNVSHLKWIPVLAMFFFINMYALGFGPVPWLMMTELIPTTNKRWTSGIVGFMNWAGMFFIWQTFNHFSGAEGFQFAFAIFSVSCFIASVFVNFYVPETKRRTVKEIQDILHCD